MGKMIEFPRPDGGNCSGYLAAGPDGAPGVIVIQEWWGLNDQICGVADRFARAGFSALAPDLYQGQVTQAPDEASHLMDGLDFPGATHNDIRGAVRYLASPGSRVAVMGFCMGGAHTIGAAVHVPEVAAAVCFYGIPPKEFADPARIAVPFQGHFANLDDWCTADAANDLESAMRAAGQDPEVFRYEAHHAFFNERRADVYSAESANLAWDRTIDFLLRTLR